MGILLWILALWVLLNVAFVGLRLIATGRSQSLQNRALETATFWMPGASA